MCLLRLSALGDVTHVVPLVRTLQAARPDTPIHWIIDKVGQKLLDGLPGVTFHAYDKKTGMAGVKELRKQLPPVRIQLPKIDMRAWLARATRKTVRCTAAVHCASRLMVQSLLLSIRSPTKP